MARRKREAELDGGRESLDGRRQTDGDAAQRACSPHQKTLPLVLPNLLTAWRSESRRRIEAAGLRLDGGRTTARGHAATPEASQALVSDGDYVLQQENRWTQSAMAASCREERKRERGRRRFPTTLAAMRTTGDGVRSG